MLFRTKPLSNSRKVKPLCSVPHFQHIDIDRRQQVNYVAYLQPELIVNYCKLVIVSVDNPMVSKEVRDGIGATFPFLCDSDRKIIRELDIVDTTDTVHGPVALPYTFLLDLSSVVELCGRSSVPSSTTTSHQSFFGLVSRARRVLCSRRRPGKCAHRVATGMWTDERTGAI